MTLYTIGHSTHSEAEFTWLLKQHGVDHLIDVRSYPGSRKFPHFNQSAMPDWLGKAGIEYHHYPSLGGRRNKPKDLQESDQWFRVVGFRNYAGHTRTEEFRSAYETLIEFTREHDAAICCSEYSRFQCHRRMISDVASAEGYEVLHIESSGKLSIHEPSGWTEQPGFWVPARTGPTCTD